MGNKAIDFNFRENVVDNLFYKPKISVRWERSLTLFSLEGQMKYYKQLQIILQLPFSESFKEAFYIHRIMK